MPEPPLSIKPADTAAASFGVATALVAANVSVVDGAAGVDDGGAFVSGLALALLVPALAAVGALGSAGLSTSADRSPRDAGTLLADTLLLYTGSNSSVAGAAQRGHQPDERCCCYASGKTPHASHKQTW